jgi:hypothetical protein
VLPLLESSPDLTPAGIFDHLCEPHTNQFDPRSRRTLERRIGRWRQLRTDSLSAAYKNRQEQDDFTERFAGFCRHYGVQATRNNRGVAHENGAIESPNNHIKQQLKQALPDTWQP